MKLWRLSSALLGLALALGCTNTKVHVFSGYRFDPANDCLGSAVVIDVLDGPDPGPCDVVKCWVSPHAEIYVTDAACAAPPDFVDRTGDPPKGACAQALAAYGKPDHSRCATMPDGGL